MKKVGIFTIYIANYGAVLQTYALQRYLRDKYDDLDVEVVDFYTHAPYAIFKKASTNPVKNAIKQCARALHYGSLKRRNDRELIFIKEEFKLSRRYESIDELMKNMPKYDIYLTGSDQVFNTNSRYRQLFFQQFNASGGIKAAYAPSFGTSDFPEEYRKAIHSPLSEFKYMSCREDDGAEMMAEVLGRGVPRVLDPTLLLSKDQWKSMMSEPKGNDKFLLIYDLNGGQRMIDYASKIAREKGLKVWCITQHADVRYKRVDKLIFDAGPREFVGLFAKADYVVTDSFHGTSFSLIFEKEFNTYIAVPRASRRILALLKDCGKLDRVVNLEDNTDVLASAKASEKSNNAMVELRRESYNFIDKIVSA